MSRTLSKKLYGYEKRVFWVLVLGIAGCLALYGYFVGKSIVNVVVREEIEIAIGEIHSHLSELESQYLAKKDGLNLSLAHELGFTEAAGRIFVNRSTLVGRSQPLNNEI